MYFLNAEKHVPIKRPNFLVGSPSTMIRCEIVISEQKVNNDCAYVRHQENVISEETEEKKKQKRVLYVYIRSHIKTSAKIRKVFVDKKYMSSIQMN